MKEDNLGSGGLGFTGALTIAFIVLKLTHLIEWSWLWVLSPIWIPVSLSLLMFVIAKIFDWE